jgi:PKHD-type hydroxylase
MRLKNFVWTFEGALSSEECDRIIKYGLTQDPIPAKTGKGNVSVNRDSEVTWLYDKWILDLINPYVDIANTSAGWNFQWEPVPQLQFTKYGVGQFYNWHRDTFSRPGKDGKIRKLSVTVNLNDGYEGGDMYFDPENKYGITNPVLCEQLKPRGSISVFPSDIWHKVDKVITGTRYSLVMWLKGEPFK